MSRKIGVVTENSGQGSRHSSVMSSEDSLHFVEYVSTNEKKEIVSSLTACSESQKQYFEEDEQPYDETQDLKRTEEMLQKAKEGLCKRKEKCSSEDTSNIKEVTVPNTGQHHQFIPPVMPHKMRWLQNQNDKSALQSMDIIPLPVPGPIRNESWDDAERMIQDGSLSLQHESSLTVAGQTQDSICSSTECEDWDMGTSQATSKVNKAAEKCGIRGRNQKRNNTLESLSSNKVFNIKTMDTGQYRSQRRVEIGEASARSQNENQCPIMKHNQIWKNSLPNPNINFGESKAAYYMPEVSDSRNQEQVDWNKSKSHIKNQKGNRDQNLMEPLPCSQRNRTVSQCYIPEDSDGRTQEQIERKLTKKKQTGKQEGDLDQNLKDLVQVPQRNRRERKTEGYIYVSSDSRTRGKVDGNQKKDQTEKQKNDHDRNLRKFVQSPQRNRRESKTDGYISVSSDSRAQGKIDGNQEGEHDQNFRGLVPKDQEKVYWSPENNLFESQKVSISYNYVSLDVRMEKSLKEIQHQECFDFRNQNVTGRKPVYCSDVEWNTKKDNGLDRKKSQGDRFVDSKVKGHGSLSQYAGISRTEETSLGRYEGVGLPGNSMSDHFASKKSEDSRDYVHTNYFSKGVCSDEPQLSYDENHNSEVPVKHLNFDLSPLQDSPETVQMSATHIHGTHQYQIPSQFTDSPSCATQLHSVAMPLFPLVNSMAGVCPSTGISPANMGISMQTHAQQIPNQTFQVLPNTDIQKLFELLVQERWQHLMTVNYLIQMSIMHRTGLPNKKPDSELQAQQSSVIPMMAGLMNLPEQLPTHCNNNAWLNPSVPPLLNPSPLSMNQIVAPNNIPLQSETSFNREGSGLLMPNPYMNMNSAGNMSLDDRSFMLNHMNQTYNPNIFLNSTGSTSVNDSALHGIQTNNPLLMPSYFVTGHDHIAHLNNQSTQSQQPASGNMQNMMQHAVPDVYSQPFGSRPAGIGRARRLAISKGRGRLIT